MSDPTAENHDPEIAAVLVVGAIIIGSGIVVGLIQWAIG